MKLKVMIATLAMVMTIGGASAQTQQTKTKEVPKKACFVDANKNGVCDKFEDKTCTRGNGKGLQDGSGRANGPKDGKGVRQGRGGYGKDVKRGQGNGKYGKRDGTGRNFVDADKDGVCDNLKDKK